LARFADGFIALASSGEGFSCVFASLFTHTEAHHWQYLRSARKQPGGALMDITWTLWLPREAASVPMARRLLLHTMEMVGIDPTVSFDIGVALTEACANAVEHAEQGAEYRVSVGIDKQQCRIEVADMGRGFGPGCPAMPRTDLLAEHGRGLAIIRALADRVQVESIPRRGAVLRFEKDIEWRNTAPGAGLLSA
jgi:serine/threonine-protein kinase RsbW